MTNEQHMDGSGMPVWEATQKARAWWQEYRVILQKFNLSTPPPRVKIGDGVAPGLIVKDPAKEETPNGILSGAPWEDLTVQEQTTIRDEWHKNQVLAKMHGGQVVDMPHVGQGSLKKTELSPTPHEGKPESKTCSTSSNSLPKSSKSPYDFLSPMSRTAKPPNNS